MGFHVETTKADLAYHMKLNEAEKYDDLEGGDIVGFYEDEESGETYIQRLRSNNIHNASCMQVLLAVLIGWLVANR